MSTLAPDLGMPSVDLPGQQADPESATDFRWLMSPDVFKHCTRAACLDVSATSRAGRPVADELRRRPPPLWTPGSWLALKNRSSIDRRSFGYSLDTDAAGSSEQVRSRRVPPGVLHMR